MSSGSHKDTLGVTKVVYSVRVADPMVRTRQREATVLPTGLELRLQLNLGLLLSSGQPLILSLDLQLQPCTSVLNFFNPCPLLCAPCERIVPL
jgi:hypothetical protein